MTGQNAPAVTRGTFADFKLVKSRSTAQLVIEVPIEDADAALSALGGLPKPGTECWVAVARLDHTPPQTPLEKARREFHELALSTQCGVKCGDAAFQLWLGRSNEEEAAAYMRMKLGVKSRSELDKNDAAALRWRQVLTDYENHRLGRR